MPNALPSLWVSKVKRERIVVIKQLVTEDQEKFEIFLVGAQDATKSILLIHDWWGMLDYNKEYANRFAELGYLAMVIDLYDGHHPNNAQDAGEFMRTLDQDQANRKMATALRKLHAPKRKTAVLGWSLGGVQAQYAAMENPSLVHALIFYYCRIVLEEEDIEGMRTPVLGVFSEAERTWPEKQEKLKRLLTKAKISYETVSYKGHHGFANPEGQRHDSTAAQAAWEVVQAFLTKHLGS